MTLQTTKNICTRFFFLSFLFCIFSFTEIHPNTCCLVPSSPLCHFSDVWIPIPPSYSYCSFIDSILESETMFPGLSVSLSLLMHQLHIHWNVTLELFPLQLELSCEGLLAISRCPLWLPYAEAHTVGCSPTAWYSWAQSHTLDYSYSMKLCPPPVLPWQVQSCLSACRAQEFAGCI